MLDPRALREAQGSFQTHGNYLRAFATLAGFSFPGSASAMRAELARRVLVSPTYTGHLLLHLPPAWPWAEQFAAALTGLRAISLPLRA